MSIFYKKKKRKKKLTRRPNPPRPASTHKLCGSNFFYWLKILTHPTKKCGLYGFDPFCHLYIQAIGFIECSKIHEVHHEYEAPIAFSALYVHSAKLLILSPPSFLGPAVVPGHTTTYWHQTKKKKR